jgi:hypothetical protein
MEFTTQTGGDMTITASHITSKGNAVAFTADGSQITIEPRRGRYMPTRWAVTITNPSRLTSLTNQDPRSRSFDTKSEAASYASTLADSSKTEELAWW